MLQMKTRATTLKVNRSGRKGERNRNDEIQANKIKSTSSPPFPHRGLGRQERRY